MEIGNNQISEIIVNEKIVKGTWPEIGNQKNAKSIGVGMQNHQIVVHRN